MQYVISTSPRFRTLSKLLKKKEKKKPQLRGPFTIVFIKKIICA